MMTLGRLPQRRPQRQCEVWRVAVQFALMHGRALVVVQEFDRIFDRDDVIAVFPVDAIKQCRQRG